MINIVDRLQATADFGIPDYTNSKLLREASDEIVRLRDETDEWEKSHNTLVKEIERLRGEVERLTRERDYWARARNEWEKSARLLEQENKRLTRERDAAIREAVRYQQERDAVARRLERALEEGAKRREERAAAEAKVAKLREALAPFVDAGHLKVYISSASAKEECWVSINIKNRDLRAAAAAIREGGKDDAP